jgi:hypothetical protein
VISTTVDEDGYPLSVTQVQEYRKDCDWNWTNMDIISNTDKESNGVQLEYNLKLSLCGLYLCRLYVSIKTPHGLSEIHGLHGDL